MKNKILNPIIIFMIGLILGIVSKLFDIYTEILGNIFSEFAVWILFGTLISIYSDNKKKAMINVFLFCIGMLITYYLTAHITHSVYGWAFIKGVDFVCLCFTCICIFHLDDKRKRVSTFNNSYRNNGSINIF